MSRSSQRRNWILRIDLLAAAIVFALTVVVTQSVQAQTYSVLHTFTGGMDGATPEAGVTLDKAGNLYGTAANGGNTGSGAVFKIAHKGSGWTFSPLYNFAGGNDGATPTARVIFGPDGTLYGTTSDAGMEQGVFGTVFNLKPSPSACRTALCPWLETVLHRFTANNDGITPGYGDVVFDKAGNLYGTTMNGGTNDRGIVYELTPSGGSWTESILFNFGSGLGVYPYNGVIFDNAGNLYGTTYEDEDGPTVYGTVYQLTPSGSGWTENILHSFQEASDGAYPFGGVIFDQAGNLYGTTAYSGPAGAGTIFQLTPSNGTWTLTVLHSFAGSDGPFGGLTMDAAGNLYGTTYADGANLFGSVFRLTPSGDGWTYTDIYDFTGGNDGGYPFGTVAFDANGNLYGTASTFGKNGYGVVWEITP